MDDQWYLGVYIDAVQWVELPNTRAMSQFADGGLVATKRLRFLGKIHPQDERLLR